jgi:hypothetical protein
VSLSTYQTTYEDRVKGAVRALWAAGRYPSPTRINEFVGRAPRGSLGGQGPRFRREEMARLGIPLQRNPRVEKTHDGRRSVAMVNVYRSAFPLSPADVDALETTFLTIVAEYRKGEHVQATAFVVYV